MATLTWVKFLVKDIQHFEKTMVLFIEQLVGLEGFSGVSSLLYKEKFRQRRFDCSTSVDQSEHVTSSN